jgi:uncharacterized membrane protein YraQ (UPF0718 family)
MGNIIYDALMSGLTNVIAYLSAHVLTCLIPAFFIAGAIAAFVKKEAILRYFGADVKKHISFSVASISGTVLAVCSCTILPIFAGIYKKGSGIGPAITFLFSGPAINILAIVYTAQILGYDIGIARAVGAIAMALVIGFLMSMLFRDRVEGAMKARRARVEERKNGGKEIWLFVVLIAILVIGGAQIEILYRVALIAVLLIALVFLTRYFSKTELREWGIETWDLAKKIFPILLLGTFFVGIIAYFLPPETFRPYLGSNSIASCFLGSVVGALLYMPTLLEVPIVGTTLGYTTGVLAKGPALALLLAGPSISLPSMIVLQRIMGTKKTLAYILLVVFSSALAGYIFGAIAG